MYGTKFIHIKSCSSTIKYAKSYLEKCPHLLNNVVITAETQSEGVGKGNRIWVSPKGNLYLTAIFKSFDNYSWKSFKDINIFNLLISLSVIDSIKKVLPLKINCNIFVKWPNDIILNDAKISGILLENLTNIKQEILLVSIGVNIKVTPKIINNIYKVISLKEVDKNIDITPKKFSEILIETIYKNIRNINKEQVITTWKSLAYKLNKRITLSIGNETKTGIFKDINDEGFILLQLDNQSIKAFSVGEVY